VRAALAPAEAERAVRRETKALAESIERSTRSENMRLVGLHGMVSLEAAMADHHALVTGLLEAVDGAVRDEAARKAIRQRTRPCSSNCRPRRYRHSF
jgi:hypothetical protein